MGTGAMGGAWIARPMVMVVDVGLVGREGRDVIVRCVAYTYLVSVLSYYIHTIHTMYISLYLTIVIIVALGRHEISKIGLCKKVVFLCG